MTKQISKMPVRAWHKDPAQTEFDLKVDRQVEADGIGMGVLSDGTPFLNQRGLSRLCGVENRYIGLISAEWNAGKRSERTKAVRGLLAERGSVPKEAVHKLFYGKVKVLAYPDEVCMAVLEYYAFEANLTGQTIALDNYRRLARLGLKQFIYSQVRYAAAPDIDLWRVFKDRVSLTYDKVPDGYFGVFKELAGLIVTLGEDGLHIDEKFVPDISVGQAWAAHWKAHSHHKTYGDRASYEHNYPSYFRQAASNPQLASCYPEGALGEFRRWFREEYIGEGRFKKYLSSKVKDRTLPAGYVQRAMRALTKDNT
jgi:hypothetical protein